LNISERMEEDPTNPEPEIPEIFFHPINLWNFSLIPKSEAEIYNKKLDILWSDKIPSAKKLDLMDQVDQELYALRTGKLWYHRIHYSDHSPIGGIPLEKCIKR